MVNAAGKPQKVFGGLWRDKVGGTCSRFMNGLENKVRSTGVDNNSYLYVGGSIKSCI